MKNANAALKKSDITDVQIQNLLAMRETLDAIKKRYELLQDSVKATEQEIMSLLESGAEVLSSQVVQIRTREARYPSWKSHYVEIAGADAAELVLNATTPTVFKTLVIK